jgi:hypothetical protein
MMVIAAQKSVTSAAGSQAAWKELRRPRRSAWPLGRYGVTYESLARSSRAFIGSAFDVYELLHTAHRDAMS